MSRLTSSLLTDGKACIRTANFAKKFPSILRRKSDETRFANELRHTTHPVSRPRWEPVVDRKEPFLPKDLVTISTSRPSLTTITRRSGARFLPTKSSAPIQNSYPATADFWTRHPLPQPRAFARGSSVKAASRIGFKPYCGFNTESGIRNCCLHSVGERRGAFDTRNAAPTKLT